MLPAFTIIFHVKPLFCLTRMPNSLIPFFFSWSGNLYIFPPIVLLSRVINKFQSDNCQFGLLIAPSHPSSPILSSILDLCISPPISLPDAAVIREPRHCKVSQMMAWSISCNPSLRKAYLKMLLPDSSGMLRPNLHKNTRHTTTNSIIGVTQGKLVLAGSL